MLKLSKAWTSAFICNAPVDELIALICNPKRLQGEWLGADPVCGPRQSSVPSHAAPDCRQLNETEACLMQDIGCLTLCLLEYVKALLLVGK